MEPVENNNKVNTEVLPTNVKTTIDVSSNESTETPEVSAKVLPGHNTKVSLIRV